MRIILCFVLLLSLMSPSLIAQGLNPAAAFANLERMTCTVGGTDTAAALYRHTIDGYVDNVSVAQGDSIGLHIGTKDASFGGVIDTIKIYRYGVNGWDLKSVEGTHSLMNYSFSYVNGQPVDYKSGARWATSKRIFVNPNWASGFYAVRMTARKNDTLFYGAIPFVVKENNPGTTSKVLWVVPTNTYQAYNAWGGSSLYWVSLPNSIYRTDTVSFDRPFGESWSESGFTGYHLNDSLGQFNEREWAWVQWMESHNYPVEYCADRDLHSNSNNLLSNYRTIFIPAHSEYWTAGMRANVEAFINPSNPSLYGGGNVAFFGANDCYWFVTYADSIGRKMVVKKCDGEDLWRS
jgi:hypothetical protein